MDLCEYYLQNSEPGRTIYNIYGYDLVSDSLFTIYESIYDLYHPHIDGNLVVWESDSKIFGTIIPEPATMAMLLLGGLVLSRRRYVRK